MAYAPTLLLTRARTASQRFAKQVQDICGPIQIEFSPLIEIEFLSLVDDVAEQMIVFTSRNGVAAWAKAGFGASRSCFCVGQATADAARALGFDPFVSGGTVEHLLSDIEQAAPSGGVLHVHGRHTRGDLTNLLNASGIKARGIVAYEQRLLDLSPAAVNLLQGGAPVIVPLFSPRSAAHFATFGPFGSQVEIIAISKAAALACPGADVAPHPNADGMLVAISRRLSA